MNAKPRLHAFQFLKCVNFLRNLLGKKVAYTTNINIKIIEGVTGGDFLPSKMKEICGKPFWTWGHVLLECGIKKGHRGNCREVIPKSDADEKYFDVYKAPGKSVDKSDSFV